MVQGNTVLTQDSELPLIYLDAEELGRFLESERNSAQGVAYEWEGEGVVHIHLAPLKHAFGRIGRVHIVRGTTDSELATVDCDYLICVEASVDEAKLFSCQNGQLVPQTVRFIPAYKDLYSRSKGLLELNVLEKKRVTVIGLGSFGGQIAVELAKAGVGHFSLFDFDRVELHNLARHICTAKDLGRLKTDAISELILGKNPYAVVDCFPVDINNAIDLLSEEVRKSDVVICATDNNASRLNINKILLSENTVGIFGRAVTRAEGGDVFRFVPGGPCYCCMVGNDWYDQTTEEITNVESARRSGVIPAYMSEEEANAVVQVGLSADIEPICNMMIKLALVELSRNTESGISTLEEELVYNYFIWANRRERRFANWSCMPHAKNMPTIMRWYGAHIERDSHCAMCSTDMILDEGEDVEQMIQSLSGGGGSMESVSLPEANTSEN